VIAVAWVLLFLIRRIGGRALERIIRKAEGREGEEAYSRQRSRTLFTVFLTTVRVIVWVLAIMFALSQFDVDYGPLLVAAGGVSLAVGFGAQSLVKDFFAGFFILLEGQFSIGDVVQINDKQGTVENLNLRTTVIRSLDGTVHTIPNGEITLTSNMTKLWSRAVLEIGVAYEENTDDVMALLEALGREMKQDEVWGNKVQEVVLQGVDSFGDNSVNIRVLLKTRAGEQWGAAREYRRRVKQKFDEFRVEIPWPQRVVSYKTEATEGMARRERAKLLRYVRKMRGEKVDEAEAAMSVEERDRAATLAKESQRISREEIAGAEGGKADPTPEDPRPPLSAAEQTERDLAERKSQDKIDP
jgi:small conductance mechanosensitive channel